MTERWNFRERLAYSQSQSDKPWWDAVYRRAFPDMLTSVDLRHDGWHQKAGRDRAVILSSGKTVYIDEKVREKDHGEDIAVEVWSIYRGRPPYLPQADSVPGWACKPLDTDYVAYAIEPREVCYLLPHQGIRAAWTKHGGLWRSKASLEVDGFRWCQAPNRGYLSISIAIPTWLLFEAINDAMTVSWSARNSA